tara:strand:+ start:342 stop:1694 length:1353 start_codon:yes stop_codon:yes gene_type:complete
VNSSSKSIDFTSGVQQAGFIARLARRAYAVLIAPVQAFLAVRRAMTPASVSVLLFSIVTLNIIWGFPWLGLFSACVGMLIAGCLIHFITLPVLDTQFSLPNSAPQGQPFQVTIQAQNRGILPALDFGFAFAPPTLPRRRWLFRRRKASPSYSVQQRPQHNLFLSAGDSATHTAVLTYHRRGMRTLPDTVVSGSFPFHLFASSIDSPSSITMPITPPPLTGDDEHAKGLLNNLGGWSHKLLSGDQLDYTGSREYETGMSVRRWDFPSWARLGIPIVREFQSPSVQHVFLIIDTALEEQTNVNNEGVYPAFEQMLSLATTAIHDLAKQTVKLQLFVTEKPRDPDPTFNTLTPLNDPDSSATFLSDTDTESMLIKLAAADPIKVKSANKQISAALDIAGRAPTLILTTRSLTELATNVLDSCTVIRSDPPQHANPKPGTRTLGRNTTPQTEAV